MSEVVKRYFVFVFFHKSCKSAAYSSICQRDDIVTFRFIFFCFNQIENVFRNFTLLYQKIFLDSIVCLNCNLFSFKCTKKHFVFVYIYLSNFTALSGGFFIILLLLSCLIPSPNKSYHHRRKS